MLSLCQASDFFPYMQDTMTFQFCWIYCPRYLYFHFLLSSVILAYERIVDKLALCTSTLNLSFGGYYSCLGTEMYNLIQLSTLEMCRKGGFWGVGNALDKEDKASSVLFQKQVKPYVCFECL